MTGTDSQANGKPEIVILVDHDEITGSCEDSEGQDFEDVSSSEQVEVPSHLPYIETLGALRGRLGIGLCLDKAVPETREPMALNHSPEYTGQGQTFNFEI